MNRSPLESAQPIGVSAPVMATTPGMGLGHPAPPTHRNAARGERSSCPLIAEGNEPLPGGCRQFGAGLNQASDGLPICTTLSRMHHICTTGSSRCTGSQCFHYCTGIAFRSCIAHSTHRRTLKASRFQGSFLRGMFAEAASDAIEIVFFSAVIPSDLWPVQHVSSPPVRLPEHQKFTRSCSRETSRPGGLVLDRECSVMRARLRGKPACA